MQPERSQQVVTTMGEASRRSGYMPLSGAASGRPLMINLVSRRGHRQILPATFPRPKIQRFSSSCPLFMRDADVTWD